MPSPRRVWPDRGSKLDEPKFWRDEWLHNLHAPLTNMGTKLLHVSSAGTLAMYTRTGVLPPVGNWRGVGFQEQGSTHSHSGVNQHCCNAELLKQCVPSLDTFSRHSLVSWFPFFRICTAHLSSYQGVCTCMRRNHMDEPSQVSWHARVTFVWLIPTSRLEDAPLPGTQLFFNILPYVVQIDSLHFVSRSLWPVVIQSRLNKVWSLTGTMDTMWFPPAGRGRADAIPNVELCGLEKWAFREAHDKCG